MSRRSRSRLAWLTVVFLIVWSPAGSQVQTGTLRGVIADRHGDPIPGVTITVENPTLGIAGLGAVTNPDGVYRVMGLPAGGGLPPSKPSRRLPRNRV